MMTPRNLCTAFRQITRPTFRKIFASAALAMALAFASVASTQAQLNISDAAPSWTLQDINGKSVQLSDFKGKVVILAFWATWCPPCRAEIPGFIELQSKYADKGFAVIGVSLDQGGAAVVKAFSEKAQINYPVVLGDQATAAAYGGIFSLPTTYLIDRDGKVAGVHVGFDEAEAFERELVPLLSDDAKPQVAKSHARGQSRAAR